jgi:hypothetical protein
MDEIIKLIPLFKTYEIYYISVPRHVYIIIMGKIQKLSYDLYINSVIKRYSIKCNIHDEDLTYGIHYYDGTVIDFKTLKDISKYVSRLNNLGILM